MTATTPNRPGDRDVENIQKDVLHLTIPSRYYLVPGAAFVVGSAIGIVRGSRTTSLRFLAENVHRPPTTVQGWYFYNKTKNYKVLYGGLKGAAKEASRLVLITLGWVSFEDGLTRVGWGQFSEVGAAVGTAGMFSVLYRLSWKAARRTLILGLTVGGSMKMLSWAKEKLQAQATILGENAAFENGNEGLPEDK